jgi:tRNA pseudouridine55 synthase
MSRRTKNVGGPSGLLLVDKPPGISSAAVVARVRRVLGGAKAGHTGTLDPFATGLLPLGIGEGTKLATYLTDADKTYEGIIRLGVTSDTLDRTGIVSASGATVPPIDDAMLAEIAASVCGESMQLPPLFSAIKRDGRPMYELARRGDAPELEPRPVRVDRCELRVAAADRIAVAIDCSKGFYVRSLARDIGERLGCGALLDSLRRTKVGRFSIADAIALAAIEEGGPEVAAAAMLPMADALSHMRRVEVSAVEADALRLGRQSPLVRLSPGAEGERIRLAAGSDLVAVAASEGRLWSLERVFARDAATATAGSTDSTSNSTSSTSCPRITPVLPPAVSQTEEEEKERSESS